MDAQKPFKRMWMINFIVFVLFAAFLIALSGFRVIDFTFSVTFTVLILSYFSIMYFRQKSQITQRPDERIRHIAKTAMSFSWQATCVGVSILYILIHFGIVKIQASEVLLILIGIMYFTFLLPAIYLRRWGNIQE